MLIKSIFLSDLVGKRIKFIKIFSSEITNLIIYLNAYTCVELSKYIVLMLKIVVNLSKHNYKIKLAMLKENKIRYIKFTNHTSFQKASNPIDQSCTTLKQFLI